MLTYDKRLLFEKSDLGFFIPWLSTDMLYKAFKDNQEGSNSQRRYNIVFHHLWTKISFQFQGRHAANCCLHKSSAQCVFTHAGLRLFAWEKCWWKCCACMTWSPATAFLQRSVTVFVNSFGCCEPGRRGSSWREIVIAVTAEDLRDVGQLSTHWQGSPKPWLPPRAYVSVRTHSSARRQCSTADLSCCGLCWDLSSRLLWHLSQLSNPVAVSSL